MAASVLLLLGAGCKKETPSSGASADGGAGAAASRVRIAVVPKGTTHEFWKSVHAGAVKSAREENVEIVWKGPLKEDDLKAQIDVVESFTAEKVSGIVLAPLSDKGLMTPVKRAKEAQIPVVVFDSDLQGDEHVSFVATDNYAAGKMAGEHMVKLLGGKGNVILLRYQEGSASTSNREKGFADALKDQKDIKLVSDNRYGGATTESAFTTSENLLGAQKAAAGGVQGVFTPNESTTVGMLLALRKSNLAGKIKLIGFDGSEKLTDGVKAGHVDALVLQDPFRIGYLAVQTMAKNLRGEPIEKRIDTGAKLVTKENIESPEIKELVHPDLEKWLGK
jgi:ribose transport system substrate-binding protein